MPNLYWGAPPCARPWYEPFATIQAGEPSTERPNPEKLFGLMKLASPADAGIGDKEHARGLNPLPHICGLLLEALSPMPDAALLEAGAELHRGLKSLSQDSEVEMRLITAGGSTIL